MKNIDLDKTKEKVKFVILQKRIIVQISTVGYLHMENVWLKKDLATARPAENAK